MSRMGTLDANHGRAEPPRRDDVRCRNCGQTGQLRDIAPRLKRCQACGFVLPLPRSVQATTAQPPLAALSSIAPGCVLRERYRLVELIGEGAHGLTYFAEHEFLNHPCVVKILPHRVADASDAAVRRLRHEAQTGFRVNDPNVVRVLDCDAIESVWYFVMEYVDGTDLDAISSAGVRLGWQQVVRIGLDAAGGLAAIHRAGLIHRDIKPANLLLGTDGRLRVADLGVVGLASGGPSLTRPGHAIGVGTLNYAAPELLDPEAPVDATADLYSLGATLYHVVTGRLPHGADSVYQTLIDAQSRAPRWPEDGPPDVPDWFISMVLRLLATDPAERFASAEALRDCMEHPLAKPARAAPRPPAGEELVPRGLAVLPFENEEAEGGDDWLGFALADSLARELSQTPGLYVADHEQFKSCLARLEAAAFPSHSERVLAAGRLVGAGTVISGRFRRSGGRIGFSAEVCRFGEHESLLIGPLEAALSKLVDLQADLYEQLLRALGLGGAERPTASAATEGPIALELREKLIRGKQAYLRGEYETAIRLARETIEQDPRQVEPLSYIGACYARLGRYEEAAAHHQQLMQIAEERGDKRVLLEAHANLGAMHYFKGEYETAHECYTQAAELADEVGLMPERAQIDNNAGFALFRLGRPREAEQAYLRAIETLKAYGALAALIGPFNGMGNVLLEQQRFDEARDYYERALRLGQEVGDRTNIGVSHMHLGRCASLQGRFAAAKNEFALALNALEETSFWNVLARTYGYMAEMNLRLSDVAEAIRCADKRIELAQRHANRTMEAAAWHQKAQALRIAGRDTEAEMCLTHLVEGGSEDAAVLS